MRKINIDQLPIYSDWPARLLGIESFIQRIKSKKEVDREYENEKWGALLNFIQSNPLSLGLAEADNFFQNGDQVVLNIKDELYAASSLKAHQLYMDEIVSRFSEYMPNNTLVELGAGYGSVILNLAKRDLFKKVVKLIAAEYTQSGVACIKLLSAAENISLEAGLCDFTQSSICDLKIPEKALIYTSWAAAMVPLLEDTFVDSLIKLKPAVVLHFEPCLEHYDKSLLGLLRKRYLHLNDYNTNLLTLLKKRESLGDIKIIKEEPCFYGDNCLMPCSFIVWHPVESNVC